MVDERGVEVKIGGSLTDIVNNLAEIRFADTSPDEVVGLIVRFAVDMVPGAAGAVLTLPGSPADTKQLTAAAVSEDRFGELEFAASPAVDAATGHAQVCTGGNFAPWPEFAQAARRLGVRDAIASPVPIQTGRSGSLTIYSLDLLFSQQAAVAVDVLAGHCATTVANAMAFNQLAVANQQLTEGLRSREIIGLAKGILMRQERCSEADAFRILARSSQRMNRKVRDVAQHVIALAEGRSDLTRGDHD